MMDRALNVSVVYGVTTCLSLLLAGGYCAVVRKKENWLIWLYFSVFVANLGYFALSISKTVEEALLANRLAYLGCVFLPLFMLMTILKVCKINCSKMAIGILIAISFVIFLIAASPGYLDCYYKAVSIEFVNGSAKLNKVYGPLHSLYYIYLFVYLLGMVGVILYAAKKKHIRMVKHACLLVVVVSFNVCIWLIEQLISWEFEFLSVSYIASEVLLLLLYGILQDYEEREQPVLMEQGMPEEVQTEEKTPENMDFPEAELLSDREKEVLIGMLQDKKRKEIAEELCITENTVKKHVTSIFRKLEVTNRNELIKKLTQN